MLGSIDYALPRGNATIQTRDVRGQIDTKIRTVDAFERINACEQIDAKIRTSDARYRIR